MPNGGVLGGDSSAGCGKICPCRRQPAPGAAGDRGLGPRSRGSSADCLASRAAPAAQARGWR